MHIIIQIRRWCLSNVPSRFMEGPKGSSGRPENRDGVRLQFYGLHQQQGDCKSETFRWAVKGCIRCHRLWLYSVSASDPQVTFPDEFALFAPRTVAVHPWVRQSLFSGTCEAERRARCNLFECIWKWRCLDWRKKDGAVVCLLRCACVLYAPKVILVFLIN